VYTPERHLTTPGQSGHSPQRHTAAGTAAPTTTDTGNIVPQHANPTRRIHIYVFLSNRVFRLIYPVYDMNSYIFKVTVFTAQATSEYNTRMFLSLHLFPTYGANPLGSNERNTEGVGKDPRCLGCDRPSATVSVWLARRVNPNGYWVNPTAISAPANVPPPYPRRCETAIRL